MDRNDTSLRDGETLFLDEAPLEPDAQLRFIGRVRSPWTSRADCPKNLRQARERRLGAHIEITPSYRPALSGLVQGQWILLLTWLHEARRDLALQTPGHADGPRGTFSLRSPVRPNPIGLHLVRIQSVDASAGSIEIDAVDVLDGTPLLDIKPFLPSVDIPPMDAD